jgi:hypothetical protein
MLGAHRESEMTMDWTMWAREREKMRGKTTRTVSDRVELFHQETGSLQNSWSKGISETNLKL